MTRHERRKAAKARWIAKAEKLVAAHHAWERAQIVRKNMSAPKRPDRSPKGMGNRAVYQGLTAATAVVSSGRGKSKDVAMGDRQLAAYRSRIERKAN